MILIACVDNNLGTMFNNRRQSQDAFVRDRILEISKGNRLFMNKYTAGQFLNPKDIIICENPFDEAGYDDFCFAEGLSAKNYADKIQKVILFWWNRLYPSDRYFDLDLSRYRLKRVSEFKGNSHDKIKEELYER